MIGRSLMHTMRAIVGLDDPHTQTTSEERDELVRHLSGARTIVEIGVYEGATTALLAAKADSEATIYGIDPFFSGRLGICWGEHVANHVTRSDRAAGTVKFIRKLSHEAGDDVPGPVDFIFIDGDHSLDGIRRDWDTWAPRIRIGGIMALHDSIPAPNSASMLGSQRFFAETISRDARFAEIARCGSLAVLRRMT